MSIICAHIDNSIQVHIPKRRTSKKSFVTKMKCQVTSSTTSVVLISKEIIYKSYKDICSGEKRKVRIGFNNDDHFMVVENNTLTNIPRQSHIFGQVARMSEDWEVLSMFFSNHNLEPNWLDCDWTWGWYDEELGEWTGCMGKV